jgi:hypothetical protein
MFWKEYLDHIRILDKRRLESPTGSSATHATSLEEINEFLSTHFRLHPDVHYDIPIDSLRGNVILTVRDTNKTAPLAGCIRYKSLGICDQKQIHLVDCFCVHTDWRGKGVADYMLHELHTIMKDRPYAIFIKEGKPLPIIPFYQGQYVYRVIKKEPIHSVQSISIDTAYRIMAHHQVFHPFFQLAQPSSNQEWKLWKQGVHHVLACVQDTYQRLHGKRMGWITAWIESPAITDTMRNDASYQLSGSVAYDMIWMNRIHVTDSRWTMDGPFYWYTYQWEPSITIGTSYCLIT